MPTNFVSIRIFCSWREIHIDLSSRRRMWFTIGNYCQLQLPHPEKNASQLCSRTFDEMRTPSSRSSGTAQDGSYYCTYTAHTVHYEHSPRTSYLSTPLWQNVLCLRLSLHRSRWRSPYAPPTTHLQPHHQSIVGVGLDSHSTYFHRLHRFPTPPA